MWTMTGNLSVNISLEHNHSCRSRALNISDVVNVSRSAKQHNILFQRLQYLPQGMLGNSLRKSVGARCSILKQTKHKIVKFVTLIMCKNKLDTFHSCHSYFLKSPKPSVSI